MESLKLTSICIMLLLSAMTAMLGAAFQKFMEPGHIFNWWAKFLLKMVELASKTRKVFVATGCSNYLDIDKKQYWYIRLIASLSKPLGLCRYCNTTWLAIIVFVLVFGVKLHIFIFIGATYFFVVAIEIMEKKLNVKK